MKSEVDKATSLVKRSSVGDDPVFPGALSLGSPDTLDRRLAPMSFDALASLYRDE
jgi:hypothetical protein